jgi:hypothetical protein
VRYGGAFSYTIATTPGNHYTVRLTFAEVYWTAPGQRLMDVLVNGALQLAGVDPFALAGGQFVPVTREFNVTATGASFVLGFQARTDSAAVAAVEVSCACCWLTGAVAKHYAVDTGQPSIADAWCRKHARMQVFDMGTAQPAVDNGGSSSTPPATPSGNTTTPTPDQPGQPGEDAAPEDTTASDTDSAATQSPTGADGGVSPSGPAEPDVTGATDTSPDVGATGSSADAGSTGPTGSQPSLLTGTTAAGGTTGERVPAGASSAGSALMQPLMVLAAAMAALLLAA